MRAVWIMALLGGAAWAAGDPLPSWNEGANKQAIVAFVRATTTAGGAEWLPPDERVAVFDNDGTLWSEQPVYTQLAFTLDRVRALAPQHPGWKQLMPFQAVLNGDLKQLAAGGQHGLMELLGATHAGMTSDEFSAIVEEWLATARHPRFKRPYTELVYQPMLELLAYLRANGFHTFIVSGGGIDFMRPWSERIYGVPPEQVVGSSVKLKYQLRNGQPVLVRLPEVAFVDDKEGKPVGIQQHIGRHPVFAAGNSDGDFEMLEWTTSGGKKGPRFALIVHHTDAEREWAYDRDSPVGRLARALDEAPRHGWWVVDMKKDWKVVYPPQSKR